MASRNSDVAQKVQFTLTEKVKQKVAGANVNRAAAQVAALALQHIRDRTNANEMVNGQRFPDYTPRYIIYKSRFVRGLTPKSRSGGTRSVPKTEFAATKVDDNMRLSGRLFSDMVVKFVRGMSRGGFVGGEFVLDFRTSRSRKIAEYNLARGRLFWGISASNTPRGRVLRTNMKNIFKLALNIRGGGGFSIGSQ